MEANLSSQRNPNGITRCLGKRTRNKKVQTEDNKDPDFRTVSKFLKNANEDILYEIFLRLPECRSAISSGSVCRRWHSLISHPQFISSFIRKHDCNSRPYMVIFCKTGIKVLSQPLLVLVSEDAIVLHRKSTYSGYLDFMSFIIWASCDDLLLLSPDTSVGRVYYISNPLTKQWSQLPRYPVGFLSGKPNGIALVSNKQLECAPPQYTVGFLSGKPNVIALVSNKQLECAPPQYKVVLIWPILYPKDSQDANVCMRTFCFGTGQWSVSLFSYPRPSEIQFNDYLDVITCNGILYWRETDLTFDRIIAVDVFNSQCDTIDFPDDFVCGWRNFGKVWIGVVCKALRLLQIFKPQKKCFVMKVWELRYKNDGLSAWVLVHETDDKA